MDTNKLSLVENEYDDGVVCFGPVTESQLNRYKRLPRRTVLPSDFELRKLVRYSYHSRWVKTAKTYTVNIQSFFDQDEDKKNDQSTVLDESCVNASTCVDNSINITRSTNNFGVEKEENETIELKQSFSEDSNSKFSSPCFLKCIPNAKLIDTEVINRYIRMGSTSSNDSSLSEDQNKSTFEDESISYTDVQETEPTQDNYVFDETSTCEHLSVSSVIEQSASTNQQNVLDVSNNVCTLIHCSQKDDTDLSIFSDSELGDVTEDSIDADEYSVTPGKQRLFDLRVTKQSLRAKALVASAPFMDRIEETTTPVVPKVHNSLLTLNDINNRRSEIKESLNILSTTEIPDSTSTEHFNQISNENVFETSKCIDETVGELLISNDMKSNIASESKSVDTMFDETIKTGKPSTYDRSIDLNQFLNETEHKFLDEKSMCIMYNKTILSDISYQNDEEFSVATEIDIKSINTSCVDKELDETVCTSRLSKNNQSTDFNKSLYNTYNALNDAEHKFDEERSMNIMSNLPNPKSGVNEYKYEENSIPTEVDVISISTSGVDKMFDETVYSNKYSTNNQSMDMNKSLNETNIKNTLDATQQKFDGEKSMNIMSNIEIPTSDVNDPNDAEFSIPMELDVNSTNTSCMDKELDETVCTSRLSKNNQSTDFNKSLYNTYNALNDTEHKFDEERSMNIMSNLPNPKSGVNEYKYEENSIPTEVDVISISTSGVDKMFDETVYSNKYSTNNQSMDMNKSLNETNIENTLDATKQKFDGEKSMNIMSNIEILTYDVNDPNDAGFSVPMELDVNSTNTSCVDKELSKTVHTNRLSTNNQSMDMNKSLNETNIENTLDATKQKFDGEKSMNIMSNIEIPTSDVNDPNDAGFSVPMELDVNSTNTSCVDKELSKTVHTDRLSINNQSTDFNKSLNNTNIENTLNDTEQKFDGEKPMNIRMSNNEIPTYDVNDNNDEASSVAMEVDIESTNTSCVDKELDETVCTNKLSINNQSTDFNKSLSNTEHKCDGEKSMNIISNISNPLLSVNDQYDNENSIAAEVDIKSINTSIVDKIFDESMLINANKLLVDSRTMNLNKSFNGTESPSNNTELRFKNNIQNTSVSTIHFDDKLHLSKLDKSIIKNTVNSDNSFVGINEVNITCNTSLEDPSCMMRQYLDFELAVNEMCNDISSTSCPGGKSDKPKENYDDETLENLIEQTLSSDSFNLTKVKENFSNYDGSNLSVIIENKSLETSCNSIEQNEDFINYNNGVPVTLQSESIEKEVNDIESLNKSTVVNTVATSKSEVGLAYGTDIQIKANKSLLINCSIPDSELVENINETKCDGNSMFSDELSKMKLDTYSNIHNLNNTTAKQIFISEDVNEIDLTQNNLNENNLYPIAEQINTTNILNSTAFKLVPETEITQKNLINQDELLNNDNRQQDLLNTTKNIDNSLKEFTNLEQMFNFGDNKKVNQVEYKTPKTQKLLDFSIVQQTPTFDDLAKKQKVLNFSIVDQTPILQSTQQIYPNNNVINNDSLINFSSIDQMWNSEVVTKDEINFKDLQNSFNGSSSNNLSKISAPDLELLADESIKTNTSNFSNSSFDQTITESNLNLSTYSCVSNNTQNSITELNSLEPLMLINRQIVADEPLDSLNQTIEINESKQKTCNDKHCVMEASIKVVNPDLKSLSNTTLNKNIDSVEFKEDSNQEPRFNSNERAIVDFSIVDKGMLENVELKNNIDITFFESGRNVSNLIEMSLVSKSEEQSILSENPIIPITSKNISENSIHSSSDEINSTALQLEESTFLHDNTDLLTDVQMNDESLLIESPEKSSIIDSFHSIELNHVQEDNKRKMDITQEYDNNEKKMKVETEVLKTPMSMLYKIKNMFRSSERQPSCVNNTKENNFKSDKCYQKLNFNNLEENNENFTKPIILKKPEVIVKSKIPCKVADRSSKNDEFNSSTLSSLNDSMKQKKTIPKFSGVPVLSDVSNSSNRKCAESRIPSKFQK